MRPFRRKAEAPPDWAGFFSAEEYQRFVELVRAYFTERGIPVRIADGVVTPLVTCNIPSGLGLQNLAQTCHLHDRGEWPTAIAAHFDAVRRATAAHEKTVGKPFAEIESLLSVRLWPEDYLSSLKADKLIYRTDLEGTISAIVLDLPSSVETVSADEARTWHRSDDTLFDMATRNVVRNPLPAPEEHDLNGVKLFGFLGQSFFVASHALVLHEYPECLGPHGTLVAVPHRHALLCAPIRDMSVAAGIGQFISIALGMFKDGPGSITPNVYWYQMGRYLNVPYELGESELRLTPPDEFVSMLNTLSPAK